MIVMRLKKKKSKSAMKKRNKKGEKLPKIINF